LDVGRQVGRGRNHGEFHEHAREDMTVSGEDNSKMLKIKTFVGMGFLMGATVILAQDASWLKGTTAEKLKTLAVLQPGLGTVMIEYSNRAGNVYYAAQAGNWGLAAYS
jgi:hypothetical protein